MKLCVIPARGGSKRIPKKNIKHFHGKPIIAYSIEVAKEAQCFDRIIVSTDDNEIKKIAEEFGAEVPFMRPKELSDDFTGTGEVIEHAITWLRKNNQHFDYVCSGATQGIMSVMLKYNTPISFCVLTDNNMQQSIDRAGGKHGNKGIECAVSLLKMIQLQRSLK